ncbi:hypothetical protein GF420_15500 [candidate division GN15 bacterium]|nr:hypothetical protein [candidate division GN15 bacterium]
MKIVDIRTLDDCLGRSLIRDVVFDSPVTKDVIQYLGTAGRLSYFPDFARPFYRLDIPGHFCLKGVEGEASARLILTGDIETSLERFRQLINGYSSHFSSRVGP